MKQKVSTFHSASHRIGLHKAIVQRVARLVRDSEIEVLRSENIIRYSTRIKKGEKSNG